MISPSTIPLFDAVWSNAEASLDLSYWFCFTRRKLNGPKAGVTLWDRRGRCAPRDPSLGSLREGQDEEPEVAKCTYRFDTGYYFDAESSILSTSHYVMSGMRIPKKKCFIFAFLLKNLLSLISDCTAFATALCSDSQYDGADNTNSCGWLN